VCLLEQARLVRRRSGKRSPAVAEQLRLEQMFRDGGAVDRDERLFPTGTQPVDGPRHHLLAGPAFAGDEHGRAVCGHPAGQLGDPAHGRRLGDEVLRCEARHLGLLRGDARLRLHDALLARARLDELQCQVLDVLGEKGPSTVQQISRAVPELKAKVAHDEGKAYAGEFSIGSRLVPRMCAEGLLIRARPRGTWRSNLYEYALLSDWLPEVNLESVTPQQARVWLVRRYLAAFGPATYSDVQWWTGFSKAETKGVLEELEPELVEVTIEGISNGYLMLAGDAGRLGAFTGPQSPYVFFLPALDPYIMGYQGRRRFLNSEHRAKVFDRAGNAQPTVWVDGRAVGAWGQSQDGSVIYRLFEPVSDEAQELLASEARRLEIFLDGEVIRPRSQTPFTRALGHS